MKTPLKAELKVGDVLYTTRGMLTRRNWVCDGINKGFALLTELEWSQDMQNEPGCCRRTKTTMRRKIKDGGLPYCKELGSFRRRDDIKVLPDDTAKAEPGLKVGDPILVTGCLCNISNHLGYVGFIHKIWEEKDTRSGATLSLKLLKPLPLSEPDTRKENDTQWGGFDSTSATARPDQIRILTDPCELTRVQKFLESVRKEEREETPEEKARWKKFMKDIDEKHDEHLQTQKRRDELAAKLGPKWKLPGKMNRGDKQEFPSFYDPVIREASDHVMRCASKGPDDCTEEEIVRWTEGRDLTDQASFWSPREECRSAVKEFDLDPFKEQFCGALYLPASHTYAPNGTLREALIKLWNAGEEILDIGDMDGPDTCHTPCAGREPTGYGISHAKRRKLPQ